MCRCECVKDEPKKKSSPARQSVSVQLDGQTIELNGRRYLSYYVGDTANLKLDLGFLGELEVNIMPESERGTTFAERRKAERRRGYC